MRSVRAVGSTIPSMIKFQTDQGVVTMETSKEALWECKQLEKTQNSWKETQWRQHMEQMSRIRGEGDMGEKVTICNKRPDQSIMIEIKALNHRGLQHNDCST
ncbi:hypothetical protein Tco_0997297 [Tanacetum coccineum]